jgi:hypothetical protein
MRIATAGSIAILALSTAAIAQVGNPGMQTSNNMIIANVGGPGDTPASPPAEDSMNSADNMLDDSASPPPNEPK